jgi:D-alanine--poly(phosphoribitol) ligase subunit 2
MHRDLVSLIVNTVRELDGRPGTTIPGELDAGTPLFGRDGFLDSLGLVTLVVGVEQAIEDSFSMRVGLADERAMSQTRSPYRTIGSLAEYAGQLIAAELSDA